MKTYLILKEKVNQWNNDSEIQSLLTQINADDGSMEQYLGQYESNKAAALKTHDFDTKALGERSFGYEQLDQLTMELLMGIR